LDGRTFARMTKRASAAEWTERVRAWRESGQTAKAFGEEKGYASHLLQWWGSELVRRGRRTPRVRVARVVRVSPPSAQLTVAVGAARIEVGVGFDRALLHDVVMALGGER
jgi:hypothetical protein